VYYIEKIAKIKTIITNIVVPHVHCENKVRESALKSAFIISFNLAIT